MDAGDARPAVAGAVGAPLHVRHHGWPGQWRGAPDRASLHKCLRGRAGEQSLNGMKHISAAVCVGDAAVLSGEMSG